MHLFGSPAEIPDQTLYTPSAIRIDSNNCTKGVDFGAFELKTSPGKKNKKIDSEEYSSFGENETEPTRQFIKSTDQFIDNHLENLFPQGH